MKDNLYYSRIIEEIDSYGEWTFQIPVTNHDLKDADLLRRLQNQILDFNQDYLKISYKYGIGQILCTDLLELLNIDIYSFYHNFQKEEFSKRKVTSVLPAIHKYSYKNKPYHLFESSNLTIPNVSGNFEQKEICDLRDFKGFEETVDDSYSRVDPVIIVERVDLYMADPNMPDDYIEYPLDFSVGIGTNLFFQRFKIIEYHKQDKFSSGGIDNRSIAYRNTPRFNSYLRDLQDIWCNKYGWKLLYENPFIPRSSYRKEGIVLDGKIIYQEDIDSGRVQLPSE